ncbi:MAG: hypothetical protein LR015_13880 [Verrucomicrobia bacterium]|nr:hypothetical protein [Verrucomicrobiota bacterium]
MEVFWFILEYLGYLLGAVVLIALWDFFKEFLRPYREEVLKAKPQTWPDDPWF